MRTYSKYLRPGWSVRAAKFTLVAASLGLVAACGKVDRLATQSSTVPFDYQERHPIKMTTKPFAIKVFPSNSGLGEADRARVTALAQEYKANGRGPVFIHFPANEPRSRYVVGQIRQILASHGARGNLRVGSYPVLDEEDASPVRVSFKALAARVASKCGEWPDDLASATSLRGWNNKPYWNLGCSYQNMIAVQTSDPRDVASPRGESPADVAMRMRAIGNVRKGTDPGTKWQVKNTTISAAGGN